MNKPPSLSIVIPTYNRPHALANCINAIAALDYPRDRFEVIVVDDGSSISLEEAVAPFQSQLHITLLKQANAGPASARNTGAKRAQGEYLVFTDDDCLPTPTWLTNLSKRLLLEPESLLGGKTLNALLQNPFSTASQVLLDYIYSYYNVHSNVANFFTSNNMALSTKLFHIVGGFNTNYPRAAAEDRDFCDRWLYHGYSMIYEPEAQIYHAHHLTLKTFWQQHFNYGRGASYFHQMRAKRKNTSIKIEPLFYIGLLAYPFSHSSEQLKQLLSGLLLLSQVANAGGFFWERVTASLYKPNPATDYCHKTTSRVMK